MKLLITNIVYGPVYSQIFLNHHLKSILDRTNIPSILNDNEIEYILYTDRLTEDLIKNHPIWESLSEKVKTRIKLFDANFLNFEDRYNYLRIMLIDSMKIALEKKAILMPWVADLFFAKDFFIKIIKRFKEGYDSVLVTGMRASAEAMIPRLNQFDESVDALKLFELGYQCLHPLWVACHWNSPQFSRIPYVLLWNSYPGIMVRPFSVTPIAFKPNVKMLNCNMIDSDVPSFTKKPFWATDWTDAPVLGIEPIECFYPPFFNHRANSKVISDFAEGLHPSQIEYLEKKMYFPCKSKVKLTKKQMNESDNSVSEIFQYYKNSKLLAS